MPSPDRDPDILVLRQKVHGMGADQYVEALERRLPERTIVRATTPAEEEQLLATTPVVTGFDVDPRHLEGSNLRYFACVYAGTGHLPLDTFSEHGIAVTNAAGVHGPNIGEQVLGYLLAFARRLHVGWRRQQRREWRSYQTYELQESTVTVVGMGALGQAIVDRLSAFNVDTIAIRHTPEKGAPTDEVYGYDDDIHEPAARSDYFVIAAPLTDTTRHLVDSELFRTLPAEAVLVNVGRGAIVDTDALVDALRGNAIRGAALDVTDPEPLPEDHPLWTLQNTMITPHNAGHTPQYWDRMADIVAANVDQVLDEGTVDGLQNQVLPRP